MDKRRKYFLVVDVETANGTDDALVYDIGCAVCDKQGNVYETKSFIIRDIFILEKDLMKSAYYNKKVPMYWNEIKAGQRKVVDLKLARWQMLELMKKYNITTVCAYNASFDITALNTTIRYITKSEYRYFFPFGTEVNCIWSMCCQTIYKQKTFQRLARENGWVSENGNVKTSAEIGYNYITGQTEFEENHTGLEDVLIEIELMVKSYRQHKSMNKKINRGCWRLCQVA